MGGKQIFDSMLTLEITVFQIYSPIYFPHSSLVKRKSHLKNSNQLCHRATGGRMEFSMFSLGLSFYRRWEGGVGLEDGDQFSGNSRTVKGPGRDQSES